MKELAGIIIGLIGLILIGFMWLTGDQRQPVERIYGRDTVMITLHDTISYVAPTPVGEVQMGYRKYPCMPIDAAAGVDSGNVNTEAVGDSVLLPVTQQIYEGAEYTAYISGVYPVLDSILVYPRHDIVMAKPPPKQRWHIGPTLGYGYCPTGFQPFIGISITYSIIAF